MADSTITCSSCLKEFPRIEGMSEAICPRCGKAMPLITTSIGVDRDAVQQAANRARQVTPDPADSGVLGRIALRKVRAEEAANGGPGPVPTVSAPEPEAMDAPILPIAADPNAPERAVSDAPVDEIDVKEETGFDLPATVKGAPIHMGFFDPAANLGDDATELPPLDVPLEDHPGRAGAPSSPSPSPPPSSTPRQPAGAAVPPPIPGAARSKARPPAVPAPEPRRAPAPAASEGQPRAARQAPAAARKRKAAAAPRSSDGGIDVSVPLLPVEEVAWNPGGKDRGARRYGSEAPDASAQGPTAPAVARKDLGRTEQGRRRLHLAILAGAVAAAVVCGVVLLLLAG